jgi:hypothetical protein
MLEPCVLPIHFENFQGKHEININSLLIFVDAYKEIAEIYELSLDIKIGVPEEGGWQSRLTIGAVIVGVLNFIGIDNLSIFLTGEESKTWFLDAHRRLLKINEFITKEAKEIPNEFPKECIKQKNKIYEQFQKDDCIDAFHLGGFPSIPRCDFHLYIKPLPDEENIYLGETNITVSSPDWKGKRSWRGKIEIIDEPQSSFSFDKDLTGKFWEKIKLDSLLLHTTDVMRVQLIKRPSSKVKYQVIRVLNYNGEDVDQALSNVEINGFAIFSPQNPIIEPISQLTLPFTDSQV